MQKRNIKSDWQLLLLITKSPRGNHQVGFIITIIGFLFSFKLSIQAFYIYVYDFFYSFYVSKCLTLIHFIADDPIGYSSDDISTCHFVIFFHSLSQLHSGDVYRDCPWFSGL